MPILSGSARLAGIAGWPVAHSRSPMLHNHWLTRHGIDGAYLPLPIRPELFDSAVRGLRDAGFAGMNVTIPHKEAAFALCDQVDDSARATGALNTLVFQPDGRVHGSNTDGLGFLANLRANGVDPAAGPALLLGAGGSARCIAAELARLGVQVALTNRTADRADALAAQVPGARTVPWDQREPALADMALLVNTTSLGMTGQPSLPMALHRAAPGLAVCDIVYVPLETPLLADARARGLTAVDGLGMLIQQARPGFAAWFGVWPDADAESFALLADSVR